MIQESKDSRIGITGFKYSRIREFLNCCSRADLRIARFYLLASLPLLLQSRGVATRRGLSRRSFFFEK